MAEAGRLRLFVIGLVVISLVATLFWRLYYLQIVHGSTFTAAARVNQTRTIVTTPARGLVLDDQGRELVRNTNDVVVSVSQHALALQPGKGEATLQRLAGVLGLSLGSIDKTLNAYTGSPYQPAPLVGYPSDSSQASKTLAVQEQPALFPGVTVALQAVRQYPYGSLASGVLGYLRPISAADLKNKAFAGYQNTESVGVAGIEEQYQSYLRGTPGQEALSVDSTGDVTGTVTNTAPVAGDDVVLNLDAGVQQKLEHQLEGAVQASVGAGKLGSSAAGVVMNVRTGAVVAMASVPTFDPSDFVGVLPNSVYSSLTSAAHNDPLIDRAYQAANPPGSTFKVISTAAALQDQIGGTTENSYIPCPGTYDIGTTGFNNDDPPQAEGLLNLDQAIMYSCDTVYYQLGYEAWLADGGLRTTPAEQRMPDHQYIANMALAFGLGHPTGVDLPGESPGQIETRQTLIAYWKAEKAQLCKGAHTHPNDPAREQFDQDACTSGYLLRAGNAADAAIGQVEDLETPLQNAVVYAAVVNGGKLMQPQVAKAILSPTGKVVKRFAPVVRGRVPVDQAYLDYIQQGLRLVVDNPNGTAWNTQNPLLQVEGKTGTADLTNPKGQPIAWFVGVTPASNPEYVTVAEVQYAGYGAAIAAPVVANVDDAMFGLASTSATVAGKGLLPHGQEPAALPTISSQDTVVPPAGPPPAVAPEAPLPGGLPDPALQALVVPVVFGAGLAGGRSRRRRRTRTGRR